MNLLNKIQVLADQPLRQIDYARAYIEKPGTGKFRPLGVPAPSWRVYLHQWAQFMSYRLDDQLHDRQYGYRRNRSTMDA